MPRCIIEENIFKLYWNADYNTLNDDTTNVVSMLLSNSLPILFHSAKYKYPCGNWYLTERNGIFQTFFFKMINFITITRRFFISKFLKDI